MGLLSFMKNFFISIIIGIVGFLLLVWGLYVSAFGSLYKDPLMRILGGPIGFIIAIFGIGLLLYARAMFGRERQQLY